MKVLFCTLQSGQSRKETSKLTAEYSQTKTEHQSVSEIKAGLEEARHLSLDMIVVYRIEVYI